MYYFNISVKCTIGRLTSSSLTISSLVSLNEGYFRFSDLLMYFLCRFTIIFVKSSLNHENHILSDICVNILKLVV